MYLNTCGKLKVIPSVYPRVSPLGSPRVSFPFSERERRTKPPLRPLLIGPLSALYWLSSGIFIGAKNLQ
jgi:hypothetical protein